MTDFTKDELDSLLHCVDVYIDGDTLIKHHYREIYSKIQSMIDSFCEHEIKSEGFGRVLVCCDCKRIEERFND